MNTMTKKSGIWPFRFILLWSFIIINLHCQSMHIGLVADQKPSQNPLSNLSSKSDAELSDLREHYLIGCKKIFHQHGYMNVKGDAPYDFTCDSSHRCPKCEEAFSSVRYHISKRAVTLVLFRIKKSRYKMPKKHYKRCNKQERNILWVNLGASAKKTRCANLVLTSFKQM